MLPTLNIHSPFLVAWLLTTGGEGGLFGYSPLGETVGGLVTPGWGELCSSRWGSGFHGYSFLGERVGGFGYSPLGGEDYSLLLGK